MRYLSGLWCLKAAISRGTGASKTAADKPRIKTTLVYNTVEDVKTYEYRSAVWTYGAVLFGACLKYSGSMQPTIQLK